MRRGIVLAVYLIGLAFAIPFGIAGGIAIVKTAGSFLNPVFKIIASVVLIPIVFHSAMAVYADSVAVIAKRILHVPQQSEDQK